MSMEPSAIARSAGVLLHPTSLPTRFGIGDLGPAAWKWAEALHRARQSWWQILPIGPTGYADSPYQSYSAFAGNPWLVSPELLVADGLLHADEITVTLPANGIIDYESAISLKAKLTSHAWERFKDSANPNLRNEFEEFRAQHADWLTDYALFLALKETHQHVTWTSWPADLVHRQSAAVEVAKEGLKDAIGLHQFRQFLFFRQWQALKRYCHGLGIKIFGDIPIFVAADSADVWTLPELFELDQDRRPKFVAGVPPDYFSATGQLWGNPLYHWQLHEDTDFAWWIERLKATTRLVDLVRLDHFRGFEAYWEIPAGMPTAQIGRWVKAPGDKLLAAVSKALGGLPIVAEDLGLITPEVEALRLRWNLPGMRILQFAFGDGPGNRFLPHNYNPNSVVYTGTHDNDTTKGWFASQPDHLKQHVKKYLGIATEEVTRPLVRSAWSSVAKLAVLPAQDWFELGTEARTNYPGKPQGNWRWRMEDGQLTEERIAWLAELTELYSRTTY